MEVASSSSQLPQLCRVFTFSEIQLATQKFNESLVIGRGGFGKVYKGTITNGANNLTVAIKRLDSASNQGASEFWAEVNMLSNLRHCHLVSLIGYCDDGQEMILVYEYMSHGSLEDHLHLNQIPLSWMQRLTICIGAARGLDYLHTGTCIKHGVVHRDVKSSNILLHDNWAAKISDFGLSKICPKNQQISHVSTIVKGTFGYLDPDYFYTGKLTRKSDVYAFGVILFEVLCGKQALDRSIDEEHWGLAIWAQNFIKEGRLKEIVDANIRGVISPNCLKVFAQLAKQCLHKHPKQRPAMTEVVVGLESVLALQEKTNNALQPTGMKSFARSAAKVIFPSIDKNSGGQNQTLHKFHFGTLKIATESFSEANRVVELKPYDFLYKGKLQNGQGIIVSRIRFSSRYDSFMSEASILVKLHHENLAKLLGYCIEGTGLFLVYKFALHPTPNRLMFDPTWIHFPCDRRYKIILGVARALLYLHKPPEPLPMRIIHVDLAPQCILLDENLNPILLSHMDSRYFCKINDPSRYLFSRYLAPELMSSGDVSPKTDVFSFGLLVLETITGHRMAYRDGVLLYPDYKFDPDVTHTLKYVERSWLDGTLANIYPIIHLDSSSMTSVFEIGLLCVRADPADRPTMEDVVSMLLDSSALARPVAKLREMITKELSNSTSAPVDNHNCNTLGDGYDYDNVVDYYDYNPDAVEDLSELYPR